MRVLWKGIVSMIVILVISGIIYFRNTFKPPEFIGVRKIEILEYENNTAHMKALLTFHNPNNFSARLINTELKTFCNDIQVAEISQADMGEIPAAQDFEIPFTFNVDLLKLGLSQGLSGLVSNALEETKVLPVRFSGYCRIKTNGKVYRIPLEFEDKLTFN